jgi:hypothetical protein
MRWRSIILDLALIVAVWTVVLRLVQRRARMAADASAHAVLGYRVHTAAAISAMVGITWFSVWLITDMIGPHWLTACRCPPRCSSSQSVPSRRDVPGGSEGLRRMSSRPTDGDQVVAGVYDALRIFALEHRGCGDLRGDAEPITSEGYEFWVRCGWGARLEQWVSPADAEADLLRSALLAFEN